MATVSFIPESHQSISAMKAVIEYCLQQKKVADEDSGRRLVSGVNSGTMIRGAASSKVRPRRVSIKIILSGQFFLF